MNTRNRINQAARRADNLQASDTTAPAAFLELVAAVMTPDELNTLIQWGGPDGALPALPGYDALLPAAISYHDAYSAILDAWPNCSPLDASHWRTIEALHALQDSGAPCEQVMASATLRLITRPGRVSPADYLPFEQYAAAVANARAADPAAFDASELGRMLRDKARADDDGSKAARLAGLLYG